MNKDVKDAMNTLNMFGISLTDIATQLHMPVNKLQTWLKGPNDKKRFKLVSGAIMKIVKERQGSNL